jgi:DNA-binding response OmpR family regulator
LTFVILLLFYIGKITFLNEPKENIMKNQDKINYLKSLTVLYADDDVVLQGYMSDILSSFCMSVLTASDGIEALEIYQNKKPHIVILDNVMPKLNGLDVAIKIREQDAKTPILFATNYKDPDDLLTAIRLNLIDYLIKPIALDVLENALFRCVDFLRNQGLIRVHLLGDIFYDCESKCIIKNGANVALTKKEIALIEYLLDKKGGVATSIEIELNVWNMPMSKDSLRNLISRLKAKLEDDIIINVHSIGYKIRC